MARSTLTDMINEVRSMTMVSTSEFTLGTMNFWDNDQVQTILDQNRTDFVRLELEKVPFHPGGGSIQYFEYRANLAWLEQTDAGTAIFIVEDSTGANAGTSLWSADYRRGVVTFGSNTGGTTYYLTGRAYDIYGAAAEVAHRMANYYAKSFDVGTDGHNLKRSQLRQQYLDMAKQFEMLSGTETVDIYVA